MGPLRRLHNPVFAAGARIGGPLRIALTRLALPLAVLTALAAPLRAEEQSLDDLFDRLRGAEAGEAMRIAREIEVQWSRSGSAAMDLLLQRGRDALDAGHAGLAVDHLTALIDHDPDFAEGWYARATAYAEAGRLGPAVSDIARTLTLNPRHYGALASLGQIFEELGKPEQALEVYRTALAIHPHLGGLSEAVKRLEGRVSGQDL